MANACIDSKLKNAIALKENDSNEELSGGGRLI